MKNGCDRVKEAFVSCTLLVKIQETSVDKCLVCGDRVHLTYAMNKSSAVFLCHRNGRGVGDGGRDDGRSKEKKQLCNKISNTIRITLYT